MAAIYQLLRDHEDVSLILSVCHTAPQPAVISWQQQNQSIPTPLATPQIWPPRMNLQQSILPTSASLLPPTLSSPCPSVSFLMDFSPSQPASSRPRTLQNLELGNADTVSESVSEPRISSTTQVFSSLLVSSSAPTLGVFSSTSNLVSSSSASSALDLSFSHNDRASIPPPFQDLGTFTASDDYPPYILDTESSAMNGEPSSSSESIFTTASQDGISKMLKEINMDSPSSPPPPHSPEIDICDQQEEALVAPTPTLASPVTSNIKLEPQPTPYDGIITALPEDSLSKLFSRQDSSSTSPSLFSPDQTASPKTVLDLPFIPVLIDTQDIVNSRPATPSTPTILGNINGGPSIFSDNLHLPAPLSSPLSSPTPHLHIPTSPHSPVSNYTGRLRSSSTTLRDPTTSSTSQPTMHQRAFSAMFLPNLPSSRSPGKRKHIVVLDEQQSELFSSHVITTTSPQRAKKHPVGLGFSLDLSYHARKKVETGTGADKENQMRPDEGMKL